MSRLPLSKGWLTLILGPLSGLWIILQHPDEINTIIGAVVTIITALGALQHDIEEQKIKASTVGSNPANATEVILPTTKGVTQ